jgi:P27 family predicted phage terminase small subunit
VGNLLDELGVITTADRNALIRYCVTWKRWRYAVEWVMQNGEFVDGEHGPKLHPMARIASTTAEELHKLEREFGMTPAARPRIGVGSAESAKTKKNQLEEWRDGGAPPKDSGV